MLKYSRDVAAGARFVVGRGEQLPFGPGSFDLLTAAGSINYADRERFLAEAARVLTERGLLVVYDFSAGRRLAADRRLNEWFAAFEQRYPFPPGYEMDVRALPYADAGLGLEWYDEFEVALPMTADAYLDYILSETNVEAAISSGIPEEQVAGWCRSTLGQAFPALGGTVLFDASVAAIRRA